MIEHSLIVERLIWRGRGLSRLSSGKVVIINPGVFPGEKVQVRITKEKKDYLEAEWTEILEPSPYRRIHPCSNSWWCGGCKFGALPNRVQFSLKQNLLKNEINRSLGNLIKDEKLEQLEAYKSSLAWRYRWRGQIHVQNQRPYFKQFQSNTLVPFKDCLLFSRALASKIPLLCNELPDGRYTFAGSPVDQEVLSEIDSDYLKLPLPNFGFSLYVPPKSFFQANWRLNQRLIQFICKELKDIKVIADLYAGSGNFALPLALQSNHVLAVDSDKGSIHSMNFSAEIAGISNCISKVANLYFTDFISMLADFSPQGIILDPPRLGSGKRVRSLLNLESLKKLVWVSCDIVNTCRDLKPFLQNGWQVEKIALFDMFPQTWHMEAVFVLGVPRIGN